MITDVIVFKNKCAISCDDSLLLIDRELYEHKLMTILPLDKQTLIYEFSAVEVIL